MLAGNVLTLAAEAGWTVVAAAASDAWDTARRGFAQLLGHGDTKQTCLAEQRLDETHKELTKATRTNADRPAWRWPSGGRGGWLTYWRSSRARGGLARPGTGGSGSFARPGGVRIPLGCCRIPPVADEPDMTIVFSASTRKATAAVPPDAAARHEFADLLPGPQSVLSPEGPDTLADRLRLASWIGQAGDAATARGLFAALLPLCERLQGPEQPDTLAARNELACWTGQAGDAAAARDQLAALLPVCQQVLGPEHPDSLAVGASLAYWTGQAGDAAAARDQFAALLPVCERVLGPSIPTPLSSVTITPTSLATPGMRPKREINSRRYCRSASAPQVRITLTP